MLGCTWKVTCHAVRSRISHLRLCVQADLCRVLCEHLLIRLQRASTGTCVLTQNVHAIIF